MSLETKNIVVSKKTTVRLTPQERKELKAYIEKDQAAFTNIKENTGVVRATVKRVVSKGVAQLQIAMKLRDFLKAIKNLDQDKVELIKP